MSFPGAPESSNRPLEIGEKGGLVLELATKSEPWILPVERPASNGCQTREDTQISHVFWPGLDVQKTWKTQDDTLSEPNHQPTQQTQVIHLM